MDMIASILINKCKVSAYQSPVYFLHGTQIILFSKIYNSKQALEVIIKILINFLKNNNFKF